MVKSFHQASIKTKVTLFTLVIFVISMWTIVFLAGWSLRDSMQSQIGEQQLASATLLAEDINHDLEDRLKSIEAIANNIKPELLNDTKNLQTYLEGLKAVHRLFQGGIFTTLADGTATASIPLSANRAGINYMYRSHVKAALKDGKATISDIVIGKALHAPIFSMGAPIRDSQGKVVGALVGVINLSKANFLDNLIARPYGKTGGYYLIEEQQKIIIKATDKKLTLQPLPKHTESTKTHYLAQSNESTEIHFNEAGEELLCSNKKIPISNWLLTVTLPTAEAFAPIRHMQERMLISAILLTLLMAVLTWWMLKRQLSPMLTTVQALSKLSESDSLSQPLTVKTQDETGQLINAFNQVLTKLRQRETKLIESETQLRTLVDSIPDLIWLKDENGVYLACNPMFEKFFGSKEADILGKTDYDFVDKALADFFRENDYQAMIADKPRSNEEWLTFAVGGYHGLFETIKSPLKDSDGRLIGILGIARDITIRKTAEDEMRIAATAFESQEGMMITDENVNIMRVNKAFNRITGFSADEVIGKNPRTLGSGQHDKEFYRKMWGAIASKGTWAGEVINKRKNGEIYPEHLTITTVKDNNGNVTNYVASLADVTLYKEAEEQIKDLAYIDPLTRLPNRRLFLDRLHQAIATSTRSNQRGAILFIDLDHFKTLNDTLGHDMGDLLLQQVAHRLKTCVREGDTIARLGGDEFVVLLEDLSENEIEAAEKTESIGSKILTTLSAPYQLASNQQRSTPSIGATLFYKHTLDIDTLLKQADIAMYEAKDSGRNTLRFFDPSTQASIKDRADLESELRKAIELHEVELYYQVQVNSNNHPVGAEALVRWIHPLRGTISPLNFIPLAEETGLIIPIGEWILDSACKQIKAWQQDPIAHNLSIAVNVSAKQFLQPDFLEFVQTTVRQNDIDPKRLKLELTESSLLNLVDEVITKMQALKQIGIRFSLDDFGTGYSSLQYLRRLPLDQLKIDQSFVRDIAIDSSDRAIVRTIIAMAQSLDLNVIAEGVETEEQRDILLENHCSHYQGYLFSKPISVGEFELLIKNMMST